jgi:divalent metal cation (Fe/Co/Zn/Cd) transporter
VTPSRDDHRSWAGWQIGASDRTPDNALLRRGVALERVTLGWNAVGIVVLAFAAVSARSVALGGFGLDSVVEIAASTVVLWELSGSDEARQRRALRLIAFAFIALSLYITVQSSVVLALRFHPRHSALGIAWTAVTALVMFSLAAGKSRTGRALGNPVLVTEGRVTFVDGLLAVSVLVGLSLNAIAGAWWADPVAGFVIVFYGLKEARSILTGNGVG